jgi:hypothetical protein
VSALNSYYVFLKFAKLWELQQPTPSGRTGTTSAKDAARTV